MNHIIVSIQAINRNLKGKSFNFMCVTIDWLSFVKKKLWISNLNSIKILPRSKSHKGREINEKKFAYK